MIRILNTVGNKYGGLWLEYCWKQVWWAVIRILLETDMVWCTALFSCLINLIICNIISFIIPVITLKCCFNNSETMCTLHEVYDD